MRGWNWWNYSVGAFGDPGKRGNSLLSSLLGRKPQRKLHSLEDPHLSLHRAWHSFWCPLILQGMSDLKTAAWWIGFNILFISMEKMKFLLALPPPPAQKLYEQWIWQEGAPAKEQDWWLGVTAAPRLVGGSLDMSLWEVPEISGHWGSDTV